jgi:uncharacterized membrane protein YfcA
MTGISEAWRSVINALVSFFIAILSGLGVGSGGLLMIWMTLVEGISATDARGLNLLFFIFSAGAALVFHILRKRLKYGLVIFMSVFASVGTLVGSYVGSQVSPELLRRLLGGVLAASGVYTLIKRFTEAKATGDDGKIKSENA